MTTNMLNQALIAMCLSLQTSLSDYRPDRPPAAVFGEYVPAGTTAKGKSTLRKSDRIQILRGPDGETKVVVMLTADKGQVCELEGNAVWANGRFTLTADGLDETKPCRLVLRLSSSTLTLQDFEGRCREVYCGARGKFDGARFRRRP